MGDRTGIAWTDATWNPLRGCTRVSEGCRNCYAEAFAARFSGSDQPYEGIARKDRNGSHWTGQVRLVERMLEQPLKWKQPRRIFVNSMSDLFHEAVPDEWIARIFLIMALAKQHTFQVLTKRPERMHEWVMGKNGEHAQVLECAGEADWLAVDCLSGWPWPLPNVWLGVSVENQQMADERIPWLLKTPAAVRFLSVEPLLGEIGLHGHFWKRDFVGMCGSAEAWEVIPTHEIHQVIIGGESGPGRRQMRMEWLESIVQQCQEAGIATFVKQDEALRPGQQGRIPDELWRRKEFPAVPALPEKGR